MTRVSTGWASKKVAEKVAPTENELDTGDGVSEAELRKAVAADLGTTSPVGAQQKTEIQTGRWSAVWQCMLEQEELRWPDECGAGEKVTRERSRQALLTSPTETHLYRDAIYTKAIVRVLDELLDRLIQLFEASERCGSGRTPEA